MGTGGATVVGTLRWGRRGGNVGCPSAVEGLGTRSALDGERQGGSPQPWGSRSCCRPCCPRVPVVPQAPIHNRPQILWLQEGFPLLSSQGDPGTSPIAGDSPHGGSAWGGVSVPVSPWMPSARLSPCTSRPTDILTPFYRPHWSCMGQNPSKTGLCTHGVPMGQQYWHWGGSHQGTVPALLVMVPPAQRSQLHSPESQLPLCCSVALNQSQPPPRRPPCIVWGRGLPPTPADALQSGPYGPSRASWDTMAAGVGL